MGAALPPLVEPGPPLTAEQRRRYARQLVLGGVGETGQRRLFAARVLVVGAGGLGSPVLQYLAAAGVGTLGVVDADAVDRSNLQRQVLHTDALVGAPKTHSAVAALAALNPAIAVVPVADRLDAGNASTLLAGWDVVVDATDTFASGYAIADAAGALGLPVVWGSVLRFDGQVSTFWERPPAASGVAGVSLRDLHPASRSAGLDAESCEIAGVLGPLCGWAGSLMAAEVVKLVTGVGRTLLGRVLVLDALDGSAAEVPVARAWGASGVHAAATAAAAAPGRAPEEPEGVPWDAFARVLAAGAVPVDVRRVDEVDPAPLPGSVRVPHDELLESAAPLAGLDRATPLAVYCASGRRAARVAPRLREAGFREVTVLRGSLPA